MDIKKLKSVAETAASDINWPTAALEFHEAASPATVLELIALVEKQEAEHLATHRKLAAETLRADQGWQRYEEANADRNQLRAAKVQQAQPALTVPNGWRIQRHDDGVIVVQKDGVGGYAASEDDHNIASSILHAFASDLLATSVSAQCAAPDERKPALSMFATMDDYREELAAWQARASLAAAPPSPPENEPYFVGMLNSQYAIVGRTTDGRDVDLRVIGDGAKDGKTLLLVGLPDPATAQPVAAQGDDSNDLHNAIMNLWCEVPPALSKSEAYQYKIGHRDARHAAAELAIGDTAPPPAPVAVPAAPDIRAMVNRFLGWPLPKTFGPDCGVSFDGRKDDEWNKNKTWPIGTNLLTADEAKEMFEYVLAAAPSAPVGGSHE